MNCSSVGVLRGWKNERTMDKEKKALNKNLKSNCNNNRRLSGSSVHVFVVKQFHVLRIVATNHDSFHLGWTLSPPGKVGE